MSTVRVNSYDCLRIRVQLADFSGVDRTRCPLTNFHQSHVSTGVDHSRINGQSASVNLLCAGGSIHGSANCFDLAVANDHSAILDIRAAYGDDPGVTNYEGTPCWKNA